MIRTILIAGSSVLALAASPATAQQSPAPEQPQAQPAPAQPQAQKVDQSLVGLDVYSSDGHKLGAVTEVGMAGGAPAIRAEMGQFLGMGPSSVIISGRAIERKGDRVEIAMTADEVKQTLSKQRQPKQPQQPKQPEQQ